MSARYPHPDNPTKAIAGYAAFLALMCGLFGFGIYELMQPRQISNVGIAAYKPLPGTIINYLPPRQLSGEQPRNSESVDNEPSSSPETTGRAVQPAETAPAAVSRPDVKKKIAAKRLPRTRTASTNGRQVHHQYARYPSGTYFPQFPRYAGWWW
jgi:hypothetical protein